MKPLPILLIAYVIFYPGYSEAALSKERVEATTEYLQRYRKDWSVEDTEKLVTGGYSKTIFGPPGAQTAMGSFTADDGRQISVMITGNSILVDGKDMSGQLGSKTTYGASSPIIEDVRNSQISTAPQSPIAKDTSTNYSVNISLSVALSMSVTLNLYLLRKLRRREQENAESKRQTPSSISG